MFVLTYLVSDGFDGGTVDTLYGWHGVSSFFYELGTTFYQTCDTFPEIINKVFPGFLVSFVIQIK